MSTAQYEIYLRKVFDLANTLVVKSWATAYAINKHLSSMGHYVNDMDVTSWKYFLNLNGRYHPTDVVMTVRSLDTLQSIEFTRENLILHRATAREYSFGSEYYTGLVARYPEQEMLIRCILNPINAARAIAANDGEILYHNPALVEENETNLIDELNSWSVNYFHRWNIGAYAEVDDLYTASFLGVYFHQIPMAIKNIRLHNCHTIHAHSFHILEFLAGQGRLDLYADALTRKQLLWLYRNIRYIHRNVGKQSTFELLINKVLTDRGFPLAQWSMVHNTRDMLDEVYPDIEFARKTLNIRSVSTGTDTNTVRELLEKEMGMARSNGVDLEGAEIAITKQFEATQFSQMQTKVLESSILDTTDAFPYTLTDTLLNHWLAWSHSGRYSSTITADNPKTGGRISASVKDAFTLYLYLWNRSRGFTLPSPPVMTAHTVRKDVMPTYSELRALTSAKLPTKITRAIIDTTPALQNYYISTEAFYRSATEVYAGLMRHRFIWAQQHDYRNHGWAQIQALHLYETRGVDLGAAYTYDAWLDLRGMDFDDYSPAECELLAVNLLQAATGADLKITMSLKDLQAAMLRLMAQLSSYSVQYLQTINDDPIKVLDWSVIAPTQSDVSGHATSQANLVPVRGLRTTARAKVHQFLDIADIGTEFRVNAFARGSSVWDIGLDLTSNSRPRVFTQIHNTRIGVLSQTPAWSETPEVVDADTENYVPTSRAPLTDAFVALRTPQYVLTPDDRQTLRDRWALVPPVNPVDPDYIISVPELDGFEYPDFPLGGDLDGFEYPSTLQYPDVVITTPLIPLPPIMDSFELGLMALTLPLGYATVNGRFLIKHTEFQFQPYLEGFTYPSLTLASDLDGFEYPILTLSENLLGFEYPAVNLASDLQGFTYPSIVLTPFMNGYTYPTP